VTKEVFATVHWPLGAPTTVYCDEWGEVTTNKGRTLASYQDLKDLFRDHVDEGAMNERTEDDFQTLVSQCKDLWGQDQFLFGPVIDVEEDCE
jgi:hypothetical protein